MQLRNMNDNKVIIAGAGSGKTTYIVKEAIQSKNRHVLITTFTQANKDEICNKFFKQNGYVPECVTIQTWFSFLLQDGVRPYQGKKRSKRIQGVVLANGQSTTYITEADTEKYYIATGDCMYSDKLALFTIKCDELSDNAVIKRLEGLYDVIYVDELQDIAGYDLEFLKLILKSDIKLIMVGDPRQGTYSTNNSLKNKDIRRDKTKLTDFFTSDKSLNVNIDETTLGTNFRCHPTICDLSNKLYPEFSAVKSGYSAINEHQGIFLVKKTDVSAYLEKYRPMQLRWDRRSRVDSNYSVMNFGESKGLEFDRVLIYPSKDMIKWIKNNTTNLKAICRSKLYVGITRARHSVAFVCDDNITGFTTWIQD